MKHCLNDGRKKTYFEGWYFKHQKKGHTLSLIPGVQIDETGNASAFIQIITNHQSYYIKYPYSAFQMRRHGFRVKIGKNLFTKKGIKVNIKSSDITLKGKIKYGRISPIAYPIMGPLCLIPFIKCSHDVLSMGHNTYGTLLLNGNKVSYEQGKGYIETDYGSSFPSLYFWTQCNEFKERECSIVAAVADIKLLCKMIRGCFAVIHYHGREYRFATYLGAKVAVIRKDAVCIRQGKYTLYIQTTKKKPRELKAPLKGSMSRSIFEDISCPARYEFYIQEKKIFDLSSHHASVEYVGNIK